MTFEQRVRRVLRQGVAKTKQSPPHHLTPALRQPILAPLFRHPGKQRPPPAPRGSTTSLQQQYRLRGIHLLPRATRLTPLVTAATAGYLDPLRPARDSTRTRPVVITLPNHLTRSRHCATTRPALPVLAVFSTSTVATPLIDNHLETGPDSLAQLFPRRAGRRSSAHICPMNRVACTLPSARPSLGRWPGLPASTTTVL